MRRGGAPQLPAAFSDPLVRDGSQWGLLGTSFRPTETYGTDTVSAWARGITGSRDVYVGVVDDGVDINHPDLAANIFSNRWDPVDGVDNDHNGYVDDTHGWDFYNGDSTVFDGQSADDFVDAHGTVVAGEIGARGGNGTGGSGVAWKVGIIPAKFLGPDDGTAAGAIAALDYLTDLKLHHGLNIVATNNSWEGDDAPPVLSALQAAIQRGADAGREAGAPAAVLGGNSSGGASSMDAAAEAGVSVAVGVRWFREGGGMPPVTLAPASGRYLSFAEREEIAILRARGAGVREIARQIARSPSTISRELRRNAATRGGGLEYRATTAQWHADQRARRPKPAKLAVNAELRRYVQDRLSGVVQCPDSTAHSGQTKPPRGVSGQQPRWSTQRATYAIGSSVLSR